MSVTFKTPEQVKKQHTFYTKIADLAEYFADMDEWMMAKRTETEIPLEAFFKIFHELDAICKLGVAFPEKFDLAHRFRHAMLRYTK